LKLRRPVYRGKYGCVRVKKKLETLGKSGDVMSS
jgi:hypothetical protein